MKGIIIVSLIVMVACTQSSWAARAPIDSIVGDPYVSALVVEADSGKILFEDNANAEIYPASVLKLMVLLVVLERVEQQVLGLEEMVQVTPEASRMGGSQVYLDPKESFTVDDLLYALMIQSANDAAVALAVHVSGSVQGFVALMNKRAAELGMKGTQFHSVHGLPPAEGQQPDRTTAVDLAVLSRELARNPETFRYTGTAEREFRDGTFILRTHNHLLKSVAGCDGLKTGYFKAAGFSIVATAKRDGVRIIAMVLGSQDRKVRDAKASELLAKGFALVPPGPATKTIAVKANPASVDETTREAPSPATKATPGEAEQRSRLSAGTLLIFGLGFLCGCFFCKLPSLYRLIRRPAKRGRIY